MCLNVFLDTANYLFLSLSVLTLAVTIAASTNCSCEHYPEVDWVGPYCSDWVPEEPPFCLLSGGPLGKVCPGSVQMANESFYMTTDERVCQRSRNYTIQNCECGFYDDLYWIGPFCGIWYTDDISFCMLSGGARGRFCPGAIQWDDADLYWTEDEAICKRNTIPYHKELTLSVRQPFTRREIIELFIASVILLVGTFGNGLVIKSFASGDASKHPGSRFVIVLAFVDIISSIWNPTTIVIVDVVYFFSDADIAVWPLGELACKIDFFRPLLDYSTAWLLLAISLERARAIYKPFAHRLHTKFVLLVSALILVCSLALVMKDGLHNSYTKLHVFVDGTAYEAYYCYLQDTSEKEALNTIIIISVIGIFLPMLLIAIVYVLMYVKLRKQAQIRMQHSSHNSSAQMVKVLRTFAIVVVVFYICYLPATINDIGLFFYTDYNTYNTVVIYSNPLFFINSCLNPVIYSKIHGKIYRKMKELFKSCTVKISCTFGCREDLTVTASSGDIQVVSSNVQSQQTTETNIAERQTSSEVIENLHSAYQHVDETPI